jgi:hypothetical protein
MSAREAREWEAYERVTGPILAHDRIDAGFARLSWLLAGRGADSNPDDFMPDWDPKPAEPKPEVPEQTPEQMIAAFRKITKKKPAGKPPKRKRAKKA